MPRRPTFLGAAHIIAIATIVGVLFLLTANENTGLDYGVGILVVYVFPAGVLLTLVLLVVAGFRREEPGWAYASPIAVLALPFLLLLLLVGS